MRLRHPVKHPVKDAYAVDTQADAVGIVRWFDMNIDARCSSADCNVRVSNSALGYASPEQLRAMSVVCDWRDLPLLARPAGDLNTFGGSEMQCVSNSCEGASTTAT